MGERRGEGAGGGGVSNLVFYALSTITVISARMRGVGAGTIPDVTMSPLELLLH